MMNPKRMRQILRRVSWYPPYLGAGIKLKRVNDDFTRFEVQMKMRWYNRNLFGTHFGGSLYAMSDPFYVFIILNYLGQEYIVWDKAAEIEFVRPGKGTVTGIYEINKEILKKIKEEVDIEGRKTYRFKGEIMNSGKETVANIQKVIYVRKKIKKPSKNDGSQV